MSNTKLRRTAVAAWALGLTLGLWVAVANATDSSFTAAAIPPWAGFRIDAAQEGDLLGFSVSTAGDVNGDGFADVIIGSVTGSAYVFYGKPMEFGNIDLATAPASTGFSIHGPAGSQCGSSVSCAGDVNGDGYSDVIIGDPGQDGPPARISAAYVVFGGPTRSTPVELDLLTTSTGLRIEDPLHPGYTYLNVSGAGDVNGDGYSDFLVGSPAANTAAGSTYVFLGKPSWENNPTLASFGPGDGFRIDGARTGDYSGLSVSTAGDVNGDGCSDILMAARFANSPRPEPSAAYVIFGKPSGLSNVSLASLGSSDGFRLDGLVSPEWLLISVAAAGDINGDGYSDIVLGAPGGGSYGLAYVVYGKPSGFSNIELTSLSASDGFRIVGAPSDFMCGATVAAAGDIDGDGFSDVLVGAPLSGPTQPGSTYVILGKSSGLSNIDLASLSSSAGYRIDGMDFSLFGIALGTAGDVNGDGRCEFLVGAPYATVKSTSQDGCACVFFHGRNAATYQAHTKAGDAPRTLIGPNREGSAASSVYLDFNGGDAISTETVTVYHRSNPALALKGLTPQQDTNEQYWNIATTRTGWSAATRTIRYPGSAEPYAADVRIYQAANPAGPWTRLESTVNQTRHHVSAPVTSLGWFALGKTTVAPVGITSLSLE